MQLHHDVHLLAHYDVKSLLGIWLHSLGEGQTPNQLVSWLFLQFQLFEYMHFIFIFLKHGVSPVYDESLGLGSYFLLVGSILIDLVDMSVILLPCVIK